MELNKCCSFTGHRPQKLPWGYNESDARCIAVKGALAGQIAALVSIGVTDFYSGMADGVDVWAAQIVLKLRESNPGIKLHCIIPHVGQESRWDRAAQDRYRAILALADDVQTLSPHYYRGCLQDRNRHLVHSSAYVLAVYDEGGSGGTACTVDYARQQGRRVIIINPVARMVRHAVRAQ